MVRKQLGLTASLYQALQILSVTVSRKHRFMRSSGPEADAEFADNINQLILFDI
jgi:hypothetical protein